MYCNKTNANQLTALLVAHGIRKVVVCPGSRNAILAHNFHLCPDISCYPVTDERSAAFFALGMAHHEKQPVAICVTSGSALLNTLPGVAEAYYQNVPLLIISADRPLVWIDQQDGQTLPQAGALGKFVKHCVNLPEPAKKEDEWFCNRLINEALLSLGDHRQPVHINIPISEPLFEFSTPALPKERVVRSHRLPAEMILPEEMVDKLQKARLPLLVIGQLPPLYEKFREELLRLDENNKILVLPELLSNLSPAKRMATIEHHLPDSLLQADLVVYIGGTFVGKKLKQMLRNEGAPEVIRVTQNKGELVDTFCHTTHTLYASVEDSLSAFCSTLEKVDSKPLVKEARSTLTPRKQIHKSFALEAIEAIAAGIEASPADRPSIHLANSSVVRLATRILNNSLYPVFCNRGLNGIEGSLSTAAGYAAVCSDRVFCFIGDLSFFYDVNALWNVNQHSNFRIVLINNGGGDIFHHLPGLDKTPALNDLIAASHSTQASGIANTYGLDYYHASNYKELIQILPQFIGKSERSQLLEINTK